MFSRRIEAPHVTKILRRLALGVLFPPFTLVLTQACAPRQVYRSSPPPPISSRSSPPPQVFPFPQVQESLGRPLVEDAKIKEEELKARRSPPSLKSKDQSARRAPALEKPPPLPDDNSLIAKINSRTPAQRAASLRVTEEGKKFLESGEYARALSRLEKTIAIDSTNPYGYYYLAKVHYHMGRHQESLRFLEVAESLLTREPYWLAEVFALKGENFRAMGFFEKADSSYAEALRLNPGNRIASEGSSRQQGEARPSVR